METTGHQTKRLYSAKWSPLAIVALLAFSGPAMADVVLEESFRLASPLHRAFAVVADDWVYLVGGRFNGPLYDPDAFAFNVTSRESLALGPVFPDNTRVEAATSDGRRIYVLTRNMTSFARALVEFEPGLRLARVTPLALPPGAAPTAVVWAEEPHAGCESGCLYAVGGTHDRRPIVRIDPGLGTVTVVGSTRGLMQESTAVWTGDSLIVFGLGDCNETWCTRPLVFDPSTGRTRMAGAATYAWIGQARSAWDGRDVYTAGLGKEILKYDVAEDRFVTMAARLDASVLWPAVAYQAGRVIVAGGYHLDEEREIVSHDEIRSYFPTPGSPEGATALRSDAGSWLVQWNPPPEASFASLDRYEIGWKASSGIEWEVLATVDPRTDRRVVEASGVGDLAVRAVDSLHGSSGWTIALRLPDVADPRVFGDGSGDDDKDGVPDAASGPVCSAPGPASGGSDCVTGRSVRTRVESRDGDGVPDELERTHCDWFDASYTASDGYCAAGDFVLPLKVWLLLHSLGT